MMAEAGNTVVGVDISSRMVEAAKRQPVSGFEAVVGDMETSDLFGEDEFDVVFCVWILHHFPHISLLIQNFYRWLRPGGEVIIYDFNGSNPAIRVSNRLGRVYRSTFRSFRIGRIVGTVNEVHHSPNSYFNALREAGFTVESVRWHTPTFSVAKRGGRVRDAILAGREILYRISYLLLPHPYREQNIVIAGRKGI